MTESAETGREKRIVPIRSAAASDLDPVVHCLVAAFAADPITGFLLGSGPGYADRLRAFFSLLLRARLALGSPVLVARGAEGVLGAAMGNPASPSSWPDHLEQEWSGLESLAPGFDERAARYEQVAERCKPAVPHYYLGVIGTHPDMQGRGIGNQLIRSFCDLSAADPESGGVYLETANPSNVRFYQRAGFAVTGEGSLGTGNLWCMFHRHDAAGASDRRIGHAAVPFQAIVCGKRS